LSVEQFQQVISKILWSARLRGLSLKLLQQRGCRQELLERLVVEGKTLSHNETLSDASVLD
jgi:hypothetical protein